MAPKELRDIRKEMFAEMEQRLNVNRKPEDCFVMYETLPIILKGVYDLRIDKDARRLAAIAIVAGRYGGDMPKEQCYDLLDDMDFYYNKVKCKKIDRMLPELSKMVIAESIQLS